ncbi:MAG: ABC transporter permease [Thermodesulfobacteriota bacterium]
MKVVTRKSLWLLAFYMFVFGFIILMFGIISHVAVSSLAKVWFATPLPPGFTTKWYVFAYKEFQLPHVMYVTVAVAAGVVFIGLLISFPAAYVFARKDFPGKNYLMILYLLPILVPQMTYGIPLATAFSKFRIAGSILGIILANLVPMIPFGIFILTPFFEQIDISIESSARILGAGRLRIFQKILLPLCIPGMLVAGLLMLIQTVANFELSFLVAGTESQTLLINLYYAIFAAGMRPIYAVDAMAVIYMLLVMSLLLIILRFVPPTQMVFRLDRR